MIKEEWRPIKGFSKYQVSNHGRMKSFCVNPHGIIKSVQNRHEYYSVKLYNDSKKEKRLAIHRLVAEAFIGPLEDKEVDHIDGNSLNNIVTNLRLTDRSGNCRNVRKKLSPSSSKYKGVSFVKHIKKYRTRIRLNGETKTLGYYTSEEDAARVYDEAAKEHFGEFACLNFGGRNG